MAWMMGAGMLFNAFGAIGQGLQQYSMQKMQNDFEMSKLRMQIGNQTAMQQADLHALAERQLVTQRGLDERAQLQADTQSNIQKMKNDNAGYANANNIVSRLNSSSTAQFGSGNQNNISAPSQWLSSAYPNFNSAASTHSVSSQTRPSEEASTNTVEPYFGSTPQAKNASTLAARPKVVDTTARDISAQPTRKTYTNAATGPSAHISADRGTSTNPRDEEDEASA